MSDEVERDKKDNITETKILSFSISNKNKIIKYLYWQQIYK